jgi:spore maturation protein SpmA
LSLKVKKNTPYNVIQCNLSLETTKMPKPHDTIGLTRLLKMANFLGVPNADTPKIIKSYNLHQQNISGSLCKN